MLPEAVDSLFGNKMVHRKQRGEGGGNIFWEDSDLDKFELSSVLARGEHGDMRADAAVKKSEVIECLVLGVCFLWS